MKCQHGGNIRRVVETRASPTMVAPNRTTIATQLGIPEMTTVGDGETARVVIDPLVQMMFAEEVKEHVKRTRKLEENIKFLWTVLWAQSSQAVRNHLEALNTYETMKQESNGLELLVSIKDLLYNVQDRKYAPLSIHLAKRQFYLNSQGRSTSVAGYYEQFNNIIDMLEHCGESLGEDEGIITKVLEHHDIDVRTATPTQKENARIEAQEWYYGLAFLMGADRVRFGWYLEDLENDFTQGVDGYPKSRVDAHHVLANWKQDPRNLVCLTGGNDGIQFTNMALSEEEMVTQQQQAHTEEATNNVPENEGTTLATVTTRSPSYATIGTGTAGVTRTNLVGELPGYGTVWFHPDGIANILSLSRVKTKYHITFDSNENNKFIVHKPDGSTRNFKESNRGLYYHDTSTVVTGVSEAGTVLITTVAGNASNYTPADYSRALLAHKTQQIIGRPSMRDYIRYVENKLIPNCPVTRRDIVAAKHILGPDVGSLKGKTTRRRPLGVGLYNHAPIPAGIVEQYHDVIIAVDVLYVNKLPFIATISRYIHFGTVEFLRNQKSTTLIKHVKQVN